MVPVFAGWQAVELRFAEGLDRWMVLRLSPDGGLSAGSSVKPDLLPGGFADARGMRSGTHEPSHTHSSRMSCASRLLCALGLLTIIATT